MNLIPDKVGANPKQLAWLGGLVVVLIAVYFVNRDPSSPAPVTTAPAAPAGVTKIASIARQKQVVPEGSSGPALATRSGSKVKDFRPSIKLPEGMDVTRIDPRLKLELLAKLQQVPLGGGSRSVFDWGLAPVPPPPKVDPIQVAAIAKAQKEREEKMRDDLARPPVAPPPPPIPLKFYGYANRAGAPSRQAFFLDGDDIQIKGENDVIRGRYKIVRIGINSAVVEDLANKNQQTLPLVAEQNT